MKSLCLVGSLLWAAAVMAQPAFKFTYDASGNRVKRELIDLSEIPLDDQVGPEQMSASAANSNLVEENYIQFAEPSMASDISKLVSIFPNPTTDVVFVEFSEFAANSTGQYQLSSATGEVISAASEIQQRMKFDLSGYAAGYYLLKIELNGTLREWVIVKD
jgi:hypothetical protein